MSQPRRQFLRLFGAAAAMLALGESALGAAASASSMPGLDYSSFAQMIGSGFKLASGSAPALDLKLVNVVPLKNAKGYADERRARAQCFTLVLQSAQRSALPEGLYDISATGVASFQAFVSPIRGDGRSYQIVFNRI